MSRYFEKGREPVSSYTHFWGALASAFGTLALAARSLHTGAGGAVLIDCGATAECTPEYLLQFAFMGSYYAERDRKSVV